MNHHDALEEHLAAHFVEVDKIRLMGLGRHYRGKVRDLFISKDEIVMITSDRLSAFDVVLTSIPCKGAILNAIAVNAFEQTEDICPNHLIDVPHPNVMRVRKADPLPIEIVVRRHVTGSFWRAYEKGEHTVYEVPVPEGLKKDQRLDTPIITPSTKAEYGVHDEPISRREILEKNLVDQDVLDKAFDVALKLFERGEKLAAEKGLILVDTKYEMGLIDGELVVIDEIHTADSSRYWLADEFEEHFEKGEPQAMLDKENIRQWLLAQGYKGDGPPPEIPDEVRLELAEIYMDLHDRLLGKPFVPPDQPVTATLYRVLSR